VIGVLATAWAFTVLVSAALDILAKPKVAPWRHRRSRPIALHIAAVTWIYLLFFLLWGRAWFAMLCTTGLIGLLVAVNDAKFSALREPVVFSDLALFAQSIRHPRLYFPYLSWVQLFAVVPSVALFAWTFWFDRGLDQIPTIFLSLAWFALFILQLGLAKGLSVTLNPESDQAQHGFFCVFVAYLLNGLSLREIRDVQTQLKASPYAKISVITSNKSGSAPNSMPDVVVVQSESFFDIRKTGLKLAPGLLSHFDALKQSGICSGELVVPAWGANTMRTEHAFLSGLSNAALGYASFYPYAFVAGATPAMPRAFQARGYRCTAVHPYPSDFFMRRTVFPRLGFDEFVDETQFSNSLREGPYVSDQAVTDWLIRKLDQAVESPQFLFAITMENHGPLHLEKATELEADSLYQRFNGPVIDDLTVYLRHLANANKMLGQLHDYFSQRQRRTLLCFYGDHVPGMGHVFEALKVNPKNTDYLVWANYKTGLALDKPSLTSEQLGLKLTGAAGLM
jgi:hypothetical protein